MKARAILAIALAMSSAAAADVDGSMVARLASGPPVSVPRGDRARTGRAPHLPDAPRLALRIRVSGGLAAGVALGSRGIVAVSADDHLVFLDPEGHERARLPLGAPTIFAPVIGPGGDAIVVTEAGDVLSVRPSGRLRYRVRLDGSAHDVRVGALPMLDGGVVVARGSLLVRLDDEGRTIGRARAPETLVGALVGDGDAVLATTEIGRVVRWDGASEPRMLGRLGGSPTVGAALAGRSLVTVVDAHRVVFFDVALAAVTTVVELALQVDPPALSRAGEVVITTGSGALITLAPDGRELGRAPLPAGPARSLLGGDAALLVASSPPVVLDDEGRVAFVRPTGEVGVVTAGGTTVADERACAHPIALSESGGRLVVSCSDGTIAVYGS